MGIIIFITVVVFGISMYDFYSSRKWQMVTSNHRNDVVFDKRNKAYGAYEIRTNYDRNLILIFLGIFSSFAIGYGAISYFSGETVRSEKIIPLDDPFALKPTDVLINMKLEPKVETTKKQVQSKGETIQNLAVIVTDEPVTVKTPTQDDMKNTASGTETKGSSNGGFGTGTDTEGDGQKEGDADGDKTAIDVVQFDAEFPGGQSAMMAYLGSKMRYPESALQMGKQGKVFLRFIVGKAGEIENVSVVKGVPGCPECDSEALRVVKGMPTWKPARHNGKIVRSYFTLPVTFRIK